jgi:GLPGLI family protein
VVVIFENLALNQFQKTVMHIARFFFSKTAFRSAGFLLALAFFFPLSLNAQDNPPEMEGTIRYLVTHNWTKKMLAVDYISKQRKERLSYMWGNRSEWKLYTTLHFNATQSRYEDSEERAEPEDEGYSWRRDAYQIKRDFAAGTVTDVMEMLGKTYIIEDSLQCPDWKILNDMKEVAGHICMNAVWEDTLKQQKILVWFALDMPLSAGPERLCGLPGLILEADVNDGGMLIEANRIEMKKLTTELNLPKKLKGKRIKEKDYAVLIKKHMDEKRKAEEPPFWGIRY